MFVMFQQHVTRCVWHITKFLLRKNKKTINKHAQLVYISFPNKHGQTNEITSVGQRIT